MNLKSLAVVFLFVVVLLGATGGDASVAAVGSGVGKVFHWVLVAWNSMVGNA